MAVVVLIAKRYGCGLPVHFAGKAATFNLLYAFPLLLLGRRRRHPGAHRRTRRVGVRVVGDGPLLARRILYAVQLRQLIGTAGAGARVSRPPTNRRRPDASMTLLTAMLERPLDSGLRGGRGPAGGGRTAVRRDAARGALLVVRRSSSGSSSGVGAYTCGATTRPRGRGPRRPDRADRGRRGAVDGRRPSASPPGRGSARRRQRSASRGRRAADLARSPPLPGPSPVTGPGFALTMDDAPNVDGTDPTATGADAADRGAGSPRTCRSSPTSCGPPGRRRWPSTVSD